MYPSNLALDGVVLCIGACGSLMARHIHTEYVQVFGQILNNMNTDKYL